MSALARYRRARISRGSEISIEEFADLLAGKQTGGGSGPTASQRRALGLAAWYSGVRWLAESVAFLPVRTTRDVAGEAQRRANPLWLETPERGANGRPIMTRGRLVEGWMMSLLHRGNAYGWKLRDSVGRVVGMRYIHPDRVKPLGVRAGERLFRVNWNGRGDWRERTDRDLFHIVGLGEDGVVGLSPIEYHAQNLGIAAAADDVAGLYYDQGMLLSAYIQLTKKPSKPIAEVRVELEEFLAGLSNAHSSAVLGPDAEYKTVALNAREAQLLEARGWSVLEISRILRIPPHKLYDLTRATFSNIEHQSIEAIVDGPRVWAERLEDQINADPDLVPSGSGITFDLEALLRGDTQTRYAAYHSAILDGWMELSEARRREGLPPKSGMDVVYRPANVHVVDTATGDVLIPAGAPGASASDSDDPEPAAEDATTNGNGSGGLSIDELAALVEETS